MKQETDITRRTLEGRVVSDKMDKTVTVLVERKVKHPVIGKVITKSKKYHAHLDGIAVINGDTVRIEECAPISKTMSWKVIMLLERSNGS